MTCPCSMLQGTSVPSKKAKARAPPESVALSDTSAHFIDELGEDGDDGPGADDGVARLGEVANELEEAGVSTDTLARPSLNKRPVLQALLILVGGKPGNNTMAQNIEAIVAAVGEGSLADAVVEARRADVSATHRSVRRLRKALPSHRSALHFHRPVVTL